ncbi:MAG: hypothetical protein U5L09_21065 [Bacteroidales bacterium]|nr:hypothetical protein [Bacteroidales bacterium]
MSGIEKQLVSTIFVLYVAISSGWVTAQEAMPYDLENPSAVYEMPSVLEEISGIHLLSDGLFACIQDEQGIIFLYDTTERKVVQEIPFDKDKDYEDIEVVGEDAYVLESDGDIRRVKNFRGEQPETTRYDTEFSR